MLICWPHHYWLANHCWCQLFWCWIEIKTVIKILMYYIFESANTIIHKPSRICVNRKMGGQVSYTSMVIYELYRQRHRYIFLCEYVTKMIEFLWSWFSCVPKGSPFWIPNSSMQWMVFCLFIYFSLMSFLLSLFLVSSWFHYPAPNCNCPFDNNNVLYECVCVLGQSWKQQKYIIYMCSARIRLMVRVKMRQ